MRPNNFHNDDIEDVSVWYLCMNDFVMDMVLHVVVVVVGGGGGVRHNIIIGGLIVLLDGDYASPSSLFLLVLMLL